MFTFSITNWIYHHSLWRWPIRCISANSLFCKKEIFSSVSWTRLSPREISSAANADSIAATGKVLVTAIIVISSALRFDFSALIEILFLISFRRVRFIREIFIPPKLLRIHHQIHLHAPRSSKHPLNLERSTLEHQFGTQTSRDAKSWESSGLRPWQRV